MKKNSFCFVPRVIYRPCSTTDSNSEVNKVPKKKYNEKTSTKEQMDMTTWILTPQVNLTRF